MKLYQRGYEVLCCMKNIRLKKRMGFSLTLSDMETIPWCNKRNKEEQNMNIKEYLYRLKNYWMSNVIDASINEKITTKREVTTKSVPTQKKKVYTKSLQSFSKQAEPYVNRKQK